MSRGADFSRALYLSDKVASEKKGWSSASHSAASVGWGGGSKQTGRRPSPALFIRPPHPPPPPPPRQWGGGGSAGLCVRMGPLGGGGGHCDTLLEDVQPAQRLVAAESVWRRKGER